jgi:hypothetical protein
MNIEVAPHRLFRRDYHREPPVLPQRYKERHFRGRRGPKTGAGHASRLTKTQRRLVEYYQVPRAIALLALNRIPPQRRADCNP